MVGEREEGEEEGEGEEGSSIISGPSMGGRARSVCLGMVGGGAEDTCCVGVKRRTCIIHVYYNMCESIFLTFLKPLAAFPMRKGILELGFDLYDYIESHTSIKSCAYILCACQLMYMYVQ